MNNFLKKIAILFVLVCCISVTACGNNIKNKPRVVIDNSFALRTTFEVEYTIFDIDEELGNSVIVEITTPDYKKNDDKYYSNKKTVALYGGEFEEDDEGNELEDGEFIGEEKTTEFTGLETNETYKVTITGTYGGKSYVLASVTHTTDKIGGTKEEPHLISTKDDLKKVSNDKDGFFKLENDIDCEGGVVNSFFTSSKQFIGNFDGQGHTISNFKQDNFDQNLGLFGYIASKGKVYDLNIEGVTVTDNRTSGYVRVAGFAGYNAGTITNVHLKDVTLITQAKKIPQYVGGFIAVNTTTAKIDNCSVTNVHLDVNAPRTIIAGGFVAWNMQDTDYPSITNSYVQNALVDIMITADPALNSDEEEIKDGVSIQVGGFVGNNAGLIEECYGISKVLVYVEGTKTDMDNNEYDEEEVVESERIPEIKKMVADLGGFAGTNSGDITMSGVNASITLENAFLNQLNAGGFVGKNENRITDSIFKPGAFDFIIGEETIIDNDDYQFVNSVVGLNNGNVDVSYKDAFNFTIERRVATTIDGETTYDFVPALTVTNTNGVLNSKFDALYEKIKNAYKSE